MSIDPALLASLYDRAANGKTPHYYLEPTKEHIKIMKDLYGKVPKYKLAEALGISERTLKRWVNMYLDRPEEEK